MALAMLPEPESCPGTNREFSGFEEGWFAERLEHF